jgi:hypothetical protein
MLDKHLLKIHCTVNKEFERTLKNGCTIRLKCQPFSFDKELHIFRTDLLYIVRSLGTVYAARGICHASYVDCLLARSGWSSILTLLADSQHN